MKKRDLKKTLCITVESQQASDLKELAGYTGLNVSEVLRGLIPSSEEIEAFMDYQDFCDSLGEPHKVEVLDKIARTRQLFMEVAMSGSIMAPIGMQVAAVSYFDETGDAVANLFSNWINALQSKGCRFESEKFKFPGETHIMYFCLAHGETKKDVGKLIKKYMNLAPDAEVLDTIKRTACVLRKPGAKKSGKSKTKTKIKTKAKN